MRDEHLTYEELERYMDDTDLSQEYLLWSEPATEHLDACAVCRERLDKLFLLSELTGDENIVSSVRMVSREEQLRMRVVALRLEIMAENQRMLEVAQRLQMGALFAMSASKADLLRRQSVARGDEVNEGKQVTVCYKSGRVCVSVALSEEKDVMVVLASGDTKEAPIMQKAVWHEERKVAVAEFEVEQLDEKYEIYVDIRDK